VASVVSARVPAGRTLLVACFGAFLAFLDATIVNVAFPSIRESFPTVSIGGLSWVLNAYNIVFAAFLIVFGRLTDLVGRRRSFVGGVAVFTLGSVLCGIAPSVEMLVAFRVLQALGAAALVPASLALVIAAFPGERRAHAIGLWGASAAVAAGLGPPIGGALTELGGWRWAFLVNLPFGLAALWSARSQLVESRAPGRRTLPDLIGAATLAASLALLNLGIIKGPDWGWSSPQTLASLGGAVVLFVGFVLSSRGHRSPLVDPTLLRLRSFDIGSVATVVAGFGFYAYLLTNILWLQYVWGYDVLRAGLALVPGAVVAAIVASRLGPLAERYGYRWFVVPGALVWASAYFWYHQQVGLEPAFWAEWMPGQLLSGVGVGATLPLLGSASLAAVPGGRYATASAINSSARQLGGVLGIAILVVVLGEPTPETAVAAFRNGWVLSIVAFAVVAFVAIPLGRIHSSSESEDDEDPHPPRVHAPDPPPEWADVRAVPATSTELGDVPFIAGLPEGARRRLETACRLVDVPAGQDLVRQGDPPGSAFVVRRGRLEVFVDGRRIREVGPGSVLGELALLSGEPRSATVRARRDSTVLELPRGPFGSILDSDAQASRFILGEVAERLRTAVPPSSSPPPERPTVVSVVAAHPGAPVDEVAEALTARMATHLDVVRPGRVDPEGLARAEQEHDRVVLAAGFGIVGNGAGPDEREWRRFCIRQADTVVFVARSDADVPGVSSAEEAGRRPEVVLVGPAPRPERRVAWGAATDAWQLTLVDGDLAVGVRPLADRLAGRSLGVVLAGGAARSFASIGVLLELEDAGFHIDRLAGTSMGAVIAAAYVVRGGGDDFEDLCYAEFVRRTPYNDWQVPPVRAVAKGERVVRALTRGLGADTVFEGLPRQLRVVSVDLTSRQRQVHERGGLVDAVVASCRLPVLWPPVPKDDGRLLIDGSILDNLPADLLVERDEGPVVAVSIGTGGSGTRRSGRPRVPALGETLLRTMTLGSGGAVESARRCGAWVVAPSSVGTGLLEFHQFDRMVLAGRAAARMLLDETGGDLRTHPAVPAEADGSEERTLPV
jgi:NTE family protein